MSSEWYLATPEEIETKRIDLTLGLRGSIRYYNDLLAPGIGNVFFVRQLTWSCLAIKYANQFKTSAIKLGNAIEALGLKAYYNTTDYDYSYRGKRAFAASSYDDENTFKGLSNKKNYVQITYRQGTGRSLSYDTGIGLVESGSGYENFQLSPAGLELINFHQKNYSNPSIETTLQKWISGEKTMGKTYVNERFGPIPTQEEKKLILNRLNSDVRSDYTGIRNDTTRRKKLIELFESLPEKWDNNDIRIQSEKFDLALFQEDFQKALEFFEVLRTGQLVLAKIYELLIRFNGRIPFSTKEVDFQIEKLIETSKKYLNQSGSLPNMDAIRFSQFIVDNTSSPDKILSEIARRDQRVCTVSEVSIVKGALYKENILNPDELKETVPKNLQNFYGLWSDCK